MDPVIRYSAPSNWPIWTAEEGEVSPWADILCSMAIWSILERSTTEKRPVLKSSVVIMSAMAAAGAPAPELSWKLSTAILALAREGEPMARISPRASRAVKVLVLINDHSLLNFIPKLYHLITHVASWG